MLLAEINGKPCPEVEGIEDLITSAVFGHLRLVAPPVFWKELFRRARTAGPRSSSLLSVLQSDGLDVDRYSRVQVHFWKTFGKYGEPDLLVRFESSDSSPFLVLIEVKLNSGKSGVGEYDQLAKYFRLLQDEAELAQFQISTSHRYLVYLTRNFASEELRASLLAAGSPSTRMFGVEWNDVLQAAHSERSSNHLLGEIADFLERRGMQRFSGMNASWSGMTVSGAFYRDQYFHHGDVPEMSGSKGSFYGA